MNITDASVFWDLGCGHGSVVMQVALQTGATAVGVDFQSDNIEIANRAWPNICEEWRRRHPERQIGKVVFIAQDMFPALEASLAGQTGSPKPPTAVWANNPLFESMVNHRISEIIMRVPNVQSVACLTDLYPHVRPLERKRNPRPFEIFPEMKDHLTQEDSVEWSNTEILPLYTYTNIRRNTLPA